MPIIQDILGYNEYTKQTKNMIQTQHALFMSVQKWVSSHQGLDIVFLGLISEEAYNEHIGYELQNESTFKGFGHIVAKTEYEDEDNGKTARAFWLDEKQTIFSFQSNNGEWAKLTPRKFPYYEVQEM
jgi:hypothetical protein